MIREEYTWKKFLMNWKGQIDFMAERRMFTKKITDGDAFTEMPPTAQCLYFHLCMSADDDGFSNMIRQSMFNAHAGTDDFNTLVTKRFIIPFQSGVIVIKHWKMHNLIRSDRYHETEYLEEKATLVMKENGVYSQVPFDNQLTTKRQPNDNQMEPEDRLGKDSIGKDSLDKENIYNNGDSEARKSDINKFFDRIWKAYPKKKGKGQISDAKKRYLYEKVGEEQLLRCINRYKDYIAGKDEQFVMYGSTFFNSGYVDYLDEEPEEAPIKEPRREGFEDCPDELWAKLKDHFDENGLRWEEITLTESDIRWMRRKGF